MRRLLVCAGMLLGLIAGLVSGGELTDQVAPRTEQPVSLPELNDEGAPESRIFSQHNPWEEDIDPLRWPADLAPQVIPGVPPDEPILVQPNRFSLPETPIPWDMLRTDEPEWPIIVWGQRTMTGAALGARDWTKRFTLGLRYVTGNSDERSANVQADFERLGKSNTTQFQFGGQFGENNGVRGTNRWFATSTHDFNTPSNWIYFLKHMDEYDEFQNLDYRGTFSGGLGYRFFNEEQRRLITRLGPAGTFEYFRKPTTNRQTLDLFAELEARWPITKRMQFEQKTTVYPNVENFELFRANSTINLIIALDEPAQWALQLGVQDQFISQPSADRVPHDLWTNVSIVYQRK